MLLLPSKIAVCVDCRITENDITERGKGVLNMLHELSRILHHNSPPFFPVGGYYNKRP